MLLLIENLKSAIENSFNDSIRPHQHVGWNRQTDLLGRFQVDDQLELLGLLHRKIGGLGAFQNLVHVRSRASIQVGKVHAVVISPPASTNSCL
jgi:hypothetical protein